MPSHTGEKSGKILSFNDETLDIKPCQHISDDNSLLERNYYKVKSLAKKASVDTLFSRFVVETRKLIPCDEIEYSALDSALYFIDGEAGRHQCCYKLRYFNSDLGEIKFSRDKKFSVNEMEMLEIMVSRLILPLQIRVNHHKLLLHKEDGSQTNQSDSVIKDLVIKTAAAHIVKES